MTEGGTATGSGIGVTTAGSETATGDITGDTNTAITMVGMGTVAITATTDQS